VEPSPRHFRPTAELGSFDEFTGYFRVKLNLPPDLSAWVAARITGYEAEATEHYQKYEASRVAEHSALPLVRDWFSTVGLQADGEIVQWSTDDPREYDGSRPVEDRYLWLSSLVDAARRYPELRVLLPPRPAGARDCLCLGHPQFADGRILCPECCGLRWVVDPGAEP